MDDHTVKRFDQKLDELNALVLKMGGVVQGQLSHAMDSLRLENAGLARDVVARDYLVNFMEVQAGEQAVNLLALRQLMARDLRTILSSGKTVTDLERIGDEAEHITQMSLKIYESGTLVPSSALLLDTCAMARIAEQMLADALDSLARLDIDKALEIAKSVAELDNEFQSALRRLATYLREDPRNVGHTLNVTFILKAPERIGDHAKNIAEYVIYQVKGKDVRHVSAESLSRDVLEHH